MKKAGKNRTKNDVKNKKCKLKPLNELTTGLKRTLCLLLPNFSHLIIFASEGIQFVLDRILKPRLEIYVSSSKIKLKLSSHRDSDFHWIYQTKTLLFMLSLPYLRLDFNTLPCMRFASMNSFAKH